MKRSSCYLMEGSENDGYYLKPGVSQEEGRNRFGEIEAILGDDYDLERLAELVRADREGRCVVLPCNIGDTVYSIKTDFYNYKKQTGVQRGKVKGFEFDKTWIVWINFEKDTPKSCVAFKVKEFGKSVFLAEEAAKAALKEREK